MKWIVTVNGVRIEVEATTVRTAVARALDDYQKRSTGAKYWSIQVSKA